MSFSRHANGSWVLCLHNLSAGTLLFFFFIKMVVTATGVVITFISCSVVRKWMIHYLANCVLSWNRKVLLASDFWSFVTKDVRVSVYFSIGIVTRKTFATSNLHSVSISRVLDCFRPLGNYCSSWSFLFNKSSGILDWIISLFDQSSRRCSSRVSFGFFVCKDDVLTELFHGFVCHPVIDFRSLI